MTMKTPELNGIDCPKLRTALCQVETRQWDVEGNAARTLVALDEAGRQGADLAITPECVFHGYGFDGVEDLRAATEAAAETVDDPRIRAVRARARDHHMAVIVGFVERGADGALHNAAAHIAPDGAVPEVYRKVHCRDFERVNGQGAFTPGDAFSVQRVTGRGGAFQVGTMICFDREVVESVRCLRALGAQLVACPLATDTGDLGQYIDHADNEMVTRCRAAENEVFIAVVNHAGRFNGGSFVVGPGGERIVQMGREPGVTVVDLPLGAIPRLFHGEPLGWMGWGYRRPEVYQEYLSR